MVQFGKRIKQIAEGNPKFSSYYLDYKSLKKALKVIHDTTDECRDVNPGEMDVDDDEGDAEVRDAEERFVLALEGEFAKVESFFRRIVAEMSSEFKVVCRKATALPRIQVAASAAAVVVSFEDLKAKLTDHPEHYETVCLLLAFAEDVDNVRKFVMTNAQALVKICKKHDKASTIAIKEHYIDVLRRCTFYNSRNFGALIADTVMLAMLLVEKLIGRKCQPKYDFCCPICMHVLSNPLMLSCNHRFCNSCVSMSTFFGKHNCPVCRQECQEEEEHMRIDTLVSCFDRLLRPKDPSKGTGTAVVADDVRDPASVPDLPATRICVLQNPCNKCNKRSRYLENVLCLPCPEKTLPRSGSKETLPRSTSKDGLKLLPRSDSRDSLEDEIKSNASSEPGHSPHASPHIRRSSHVIIEQIMRENENARLMKERKDLNRHNMFPPELAAEKGQSPPRIFGAGAHGAAASVPSPAHHEGGDVADALAASSPFTLESQVPDCEL